MLPRLFRKPRMALEIHVLTPTAMLPLTIEPKDGFERIWQRTYFDESVNASGWRGHWFLPVDPSDAVGSEELILKAQRAPRGRSSLQRADRAYRMLREIKGLRALGEDGVPVPELVAWGIERCGGRPERTFLLQRRVEGAEDFHALLSRERRPAARRRAIDAVGAAVAALHARGHFHRNLACRNLLLRERGDALEVFFIDCPRVVCDAPAWRRGYFARADRVFLALHAAKTGASGDELRALLAACGEPDANRALSPVRTRLAERPVTLRERAWLWLGI